MLWGWSRYYSGAAAKATFAIPLRLTKMTTIPRSMRCSTFGWSALLASTMIITAGKKSPSCTGSSSSSSSKCESDDRNVNNIMTRASPWYQEPTIALMTTPATPSSSLSSNLVAIDASAQHHHANTGNITDFQHSNRITTPTQARRWWRFHWWHDGTQHNHPTTSYTTTTHNTTLWWKRIGQSFFVITRGLEIIIRLSPLIVLTPTAMIVSYIDKTSRSIFWYGTWKRNYHIGPLTTSSPPHVLSLSDLQVHDNIYTTQFQEESNISSSSTSSLLQQHHNNYQTPTSWASDIAWSYTLHTLQCLGPAFVKLGQWAATRRDLFPVHVCNRFAELHDTARVHDWKHTHQALVNAFGSDYEERGLVVVRNYTNVKSKSNNISNTINEEEEEASTKKYRGGILGSGCAAQVHIGKLYNKTVAIKVLHPHTRTSIERDLALMQYIADFIDNCIPLKVVKMLSLSRAVSNFANVMTGQVDLRIEGYNLRMFRDNFGCSEYYHDTDDDDERRTNTASTTKPYQPITFPYPELDWVSEHVLVEEYAGDDAFPISKYLLDGSSDGLKTRKELAGILLRAFLKMVFIDNFIHADLHPG